ncbi:MAG TPA: 2-phospho-L-lactate transferase [Acidimicrobiales bacterium]|nr:2-phospho-L-lactate transferase [Acidimicrobiales bacterium]
MTALAGGVGAARMLRGIAAVTGQEQITAVVNTGDDTVLHGLYVSPDLDTVTYTLGGVDNPETGWGIAGETWAVMAALRAFEGPSFTGSTLEPSRRAERLGLTWFNLGDVDLATHLFRTGQLAAGATLSQVTAAIAQRFGVRARVIPMTDSRVETRVTVELGPEHAALGGPGAVELGFQEYFVGLRHGVEVKAVRFEGVAQAAPAPGALEAIKEAEMLVICPSNPVVSIGPVLAVREIAGAVAVRRESTVAVSPIIAGKALKGPADRMLAELGMEASAVGVAKIWAPYAATLVVDTADADLAGDIEDSGMRCVVAPSVMSGPAEAANLARTVLAAAGAQI